MSKGIKEFISLVNHKKITAICTDNSLFKSNLIIDEYHYYGNKPKHSDDKLSAVPYMIGIDFSTGKDVTSIRHPDGRITHVKK